MDQNGIFEWNGDKGQELICTRSWAAWAITAFPSDYHFSTNHRTVNLTPGDYKFVVMHISYGGGTGFEFRFGTPSIPFPTVVKPADSEQAGMWSIKKLSNLKDIEGQIEQVAQLNNLSKNQTYYFRARAQNSNGVDWSDDSSSFRTENKLDLMMVKLLRYTKRGLTSGRSDGILLPRVGCLVKL